MRFGKCLPKTYGKQIINIIPGTNGKIYEAFVYSSMQATVRHIAVKIYKIVIEIVLYFTFPNIMAPKNKNEDNPNI